MFKNFERKNKTEYSDSHKLQLTSYIIPAVCPDEPYFPIGILYQVHLKYTINYSYHQILYAFYRKFGYWRKI
jgi:hypothetical protein